MIPPSTMNDLKFACRQLLKNPGFTAVAVLTLALGIGVNTGVFSVISGLLIRPRVSKDPDSFVHLSPQYSYSGRDEEAGMPGAISLADFRAYRTATNSLSDLAGWAIQRIRIGTSAQQELAMLVTSNFFSIYGLERAKLGDSFLPTSAPHRGLLPWSCSARRSGGTSSEPILRSLAPPLISAAIRSRLWV